MVNPIEPKRKWTEKEIEAEVCRAAADQAGVSANGVTRESRLTEDIGFDSLDVTEMMMKLEDTFDLKVGDDQFEADPPQSVGDVVRIVEKALRDADSANR